MRSVSARLCSHAAGCQDGVKGLRYWDEWRAMRNEDANRQSFAVIDRFDTCRSQSVMQKRQSPTNLDRSRSP
jgi:hypothetical protein